MFRKATAVLLSIAVAVTSSPVFAQTPIGELQTNARDQKAALADMQSELNELKSQAATLSEAIKLIVANQQVTQRMAGLTPERARENAIAQKDEVKSAEQTIANIPDSSIDPKLKESLRKCIANAYQAATADLDSGKKDPSSLLKACPDAQDLGEQLKAAKQTAIDAWKQCRKVLVDAKTIHTTALPEDPSGLSLPSASEVSKRLSALEGLAKEATGDVQGCAKKLKDVERQISDQDKAAAALSLTMAFAAQVCVSSGANPYVCAGIFLISALMSLFNGGKGKGGDKKEAGGGGQFDTANTLPGKNADLGPLTPGGNFGADPTGKLGCDRDGVRLTCWQIAAPKIRLLIDPGKSVQAKDPLAPKLAETIT